MFVENMPNLYDDLSPQPVFEVFCYLRCLLGPGHLFNGTMKSDYNIRDLFNGIDKPKKIDTLNHPDYHHIG